MLPFASGSHVHIEDTELSLTDKHRDPDIQNIELHKLNKWLQDRTQKLPASAYFIEWPLCPNLDSSAYACHGRRIGHPRVGNPCTQTRSTPDKELGVQDRVDGLRTNEVRVLCVLKRYALAGDGVACVGDVRRIVPDVVIKEDLDFGCVGWIQE